MTAGSSCAARPATDPSSSSKPALVISIPLPARRTRSGSRVERGALEFFAGDDELAARVPHLVAVDEEYGVLVMDDLGVVPSLADVLLGDDPVRRA